MKQTLNAVSKLTIINNGEADIDMREAQLSNPTKIRLMTWSNICRLPSTMIANRPKTARSKPIILACHRHLAQQFIDTQDNKD